MLFTIIIAIMIIIIIWDVFTPALADSLSVEIELRQVPLKFTRIFSAG